jgi:hypothetical protein
MKSIFEQNFGESPINESPIKKGWLMRDMKSTEADLSKIRKSLELTRSNMQKMGEQGDITSEQLRDTMDLLNSVLDSLEKTIVETNKALQTLRRI